LLQNHKDSHKYQVTTGDLYGTADRPKVAVGLL